MPTKLLKLPFDQKLWNWNNTVELRNARNLVKAAHKTGVTQIVHTSATGTHVFPKWDRYPGISW